MMVPWITQSRLVRAAFLRRSRPSVLLIRLGIFISPPTYIGTSSSKGEPTSTKAAGDKSYMHKQKQKRLEHVRSKIQHTFPSPKYKISPRLSRKLPKVIRLQASNNIANLHVANGAWTGVRGDVGQENNSLEALLAKGYTYRKWDGM